MKIGVSTACMYPDRLEKTVENFGKAGIKNVEIFFNTFSELSPSYVSELKNRLNEYDMEVLSVHPFTSGMEPLMFFTEYAPRYDDMIDIYKKYFEAMNMLSAPIFVFHGDGIYSKNSVEFYAERYLKIREEGKNFGVEVAQENVARCKSGSAAFLESLIKQTENNISFVLDLKQAIRSGSDPMVFYEIMRPFLLHIHANDHSNERDCLLPGTGVFRFDGLFRQMEEDHVDPGVVIEVYRGDFGDFNEIKFALNYLQEIC